MSTQEDVVPGARRADVSPALPAMVPTANKTVKRGFAFIISHENYNVYPKEAAEKMRRKGNRKDEENLARLLHSINFDGRLAKDKTIQQLEREIESLFNEKLYNTPEFRGMPRPRGGEHECVLVVVMTHGLSGGILLDFASKQYHVEDVWQPFVKHLTDIPLVFVFQACRGDRTDEGFRVALPSALQVGSSSGMLEAAAPYGGQQQQHAETDVPGERKQVIVPPKSSLPNAPNVLIAFSTVEDHVSWRTSSEGTFFISSLCSALRGGVARGEDLVTMLTKTQRAVARRDIRRDITQERPFKQAPAFTSFLTHKLYFYRKLDTLV